MSGLIRVLYRDKIAGEASLQALKGYASIQSEDLKGAISTIYHKCIAESRVLSFFSGWAKKAVTKIVHEELRTEKVGDLYAAARGKKQQLIKDPSYATYHSAGATFEAKVEELLQEHPLYSENKIRTVLREVAKEPEAFGSIDDEGAQRVDLDIPALQVKTYDEVRKQAHKEKTEWREETKNYDRFIASYLGLSKKEIHSLVFREKDVNTPVYLQRIRYYELLCMSQLVEGIQLLSSSDAHEIGSNWGQAADDSDCGRKQAAIHKMADVVQNILQTHDNADIYQLPMEFIAQKLEKKFGANGYLLSVLLYGFRDHKKLTLEQCQQFLSGAASHYSNRSSRSAQNKSRRTNLLKIRCDADLKKADSVTFQIIGRRALLNINENKKLKKVSTVLLHQINEEIEKAARKEKTTIQQEAQKHQIPLPAENLKTIRLNGSPRNDFNRPPCLMEYYGWEENPTVRFRVNEGEGRGYQNAPLPGCIKDDNIRQDYEPIKTAINASHFLINKFGVKEGNAFERFTYLISPQVGLTFLVDLLTKASENLNERIMTTSTFTKIKITKRDADYIHIELDVAVRANVPNANIERILPVGVISLIFDQSNPASAQIRDITIDTTPNDTRLLEEELSADDDSTEVSANQNGTVAEEPSLIKHRPVRKQEEIEGASLE